MRALSPAEAPLAVPPCIYGLVIYGTLSEIATVALLRSRGRVGDPRVIN